ncbi:MAG: DUF169 domain-containing protein [Rhodospirillaceae bacterium]|nr:DUF169 domain-containing protein [Rhodospirillaceae bacterium]MBT4489658.1 DUF169 domain-containing protein [Rhodospirillaceae bacterium]MBT5194128.1 DUF169 domain-containing protein [Rhodospirillaceae bacterium]MBT5897349.1 DUF169 domain-containing protein [Rhodospirillaceae bacterium]MBT6430310.1 DUF169 domain-containing protein [Rhodospirillaceae bacterium]
MTTANCFDDDNEYDFNALIAGLNQYLRLKATPIGMKRFRSVAEMEAVEKVRRPNPAEKIAMDQVVGQTRWIGYTLGITMENLMGDQCGAVVGLHPPDKQWLSGDRMNGVWYGTLDDAAAHQAAMTCASYGDYEALATSPLGSGRLDNPDICLLYMTPGQMITFINGLQFLNYKKLEISCVGESACADSWGKALSTGEPSVSIPCYAERKFGGVQDDEMLVALPPSYLPSVVEGLAQLSRNGLRYPIPNHGLQKSPLDSIAKSYG